LPITLGLGDGGEIYILSPERQPSKELKYRISTKVHQRIFSPELLMSSEQKADEMHVSPRYRQAHCSTPFSPVSQSTLCQTYTKTKCHDLLFRTSALF